MKKLLLVLGLLALSLILGTGSAFWMVRRPSASLAVRNGPWLTSLAIASEKAGMYQRAYIALTGLFALKNTEALYYQANTDSDGETFRTNCDYVIEGKDVHARWWSITVYGQDHFLIPNPQNRYAYSGGNVIREDDGGYRIYLSARPKEKNWLPTGAQPSFSLTLRLYNPFPDVIQDPSSVELPTIRKMVCP